MLPKGPVWTNAGVPSNVWIRFGFRESCNKTAIDPAQCRSSARTGSPVQVYPTMIWPRRRLRSAEPNVNATITIISRPRWSQIACGGPCHHLDFQAGHSEEHDRWRWSLEPGHADRVYVESVPMEEVIIYEGRQQIVGGSHRMRIAGQMEIDLFHRCNLGSSTTRSLHLSCRRPVPRMADGAWRQHGDPCGRVPMVSPMESLSSLRLREWDWLRSWECNGQRDDRLVDEEPLRGSWLWSLYAE